MIGFVDADILLYRCGFAAEKRSKVPVHVNDQAEEQLFEHRREVAPVGHAIQNLRTVIESLEAKFDKLEYYLSGKANFRKGLATIKPYKGNRSPFSKPVHLDALRAYLVERHGGTITDGIEADDALGIRATDREGVGCIVSTDKDLRQIPSKHYNWVKDEWEDVNEREGLRVFYRQLLTGDVTDNIPGIEGVGPVTASKIVDPYTKEKGMWQAVKEEWHTRYPDGYHGISVDKVLQEIGSLLWIQRTGRISWEAPSG